MSEDRGDSPAGTVDKIFVLMFGLCGRRSFFYFLNLAVEMHNAVSRLCPLEFVFCCWCPVRSCCLDWHAHW